MFPGPIHPLAKNTEAMDTVADGQYSKDDYVSLPHLPHCIHRQELLKESYRLMEMRKLLRGYGIRNFNLSNNTQNMVGL